MVLWPTFICHVLRNHDLHAVPSHRRCPTKNRLTSEMRPNAATLVAGRWGKKAEVKRSGLANLLQNQSSRNSRRADPLPQPRGSRPRPVVGGRIQDLVLPPLSRPQRPLAAGQPQPTSSTTGSRPTREWTVLPFVTTAVVVLPRTRRPRGRRWDTPTLTPGLSPTGSPN